MKSPIQSCHVVHLIGVLCSDCPLMEVLLYVCVSTVGILCMSVCLQWVYLLCICVCVYSGYIMYVCVCVCVSTVVDVSGVTSAFNHVFAIAPFFLHY